VEFQLRSERIGQNLGRIYTIVYTASDFSGNMATATVLVRVPHDQGGAAFASVGFNELGTGFSHSGNMFIMIIPSRRGVYGIEESGSAVLVESAFDASRLDLTQVYVGNTMGVLLPEQVMELDNNGDGLMDLALYCSIPGVKPLVDRIEPVQYGEIWVADPIDPVGIHYVSANDVDYLAPDICDMGKPVELNAGSSAGVEEPRQVNVTTLYPVRPNPFSSSTTVRFSLVTRGHVKLCVYNVRGMLVRILEDRALPAAVMQHAVWDGRDMSGRPAAAGIYFVRFDVGSVGMTEKTTLFR
jgi:hypothetical protein